MANNLKAKSISFLILISLSTFVVYYICAAQKSAPASVKKYQELMKKVRPLHTKLGKPRPGEWLAQHKESGQTFREYVECEPVTPTADRCIIYIQPLGDFNKTQRKIVELSAEFMGLYFNLPVKIKKDIPLTVIPDRAKRKHPIWGDKQILSTYVLDQVLKPRLPEDAMAYIAFTASDLWPGKGWNFVFGQASLRARVGVWSLYRYGDPTKDPESFRRCLLRTIKTATHETGHMFSMYHCILYECNMCGSNHMQESDSRPLALCPECLSKVCWATKADPQKRFKALSKFCEKNGLLIEKAFYDKSLKAIE